MAKAKRATNGSGRKVELDQPLPGMEDVKIRSIQDKLAALAEVRAQLNELRQTEAGLMQSTLNLMRKHDLMSARSRGVEAFRVPGEEKLRVRASKEQATAETEELEDDDAQLELAEE